MDNLYIQEQISDQDSLNLTDRYFGKRVSGGYTQSGEGADVVYDKETGYYYMTVTYGGLASDGGYNMRLFRSENPDGPYLDAAGRNQLYLVMLVILIMGLS